MIEMSFFEEQKEILGMLERNMIASLWHFTDIRNLPNIKKLDGLRSKEYLEQNKQWGGRDLFPGGDALSHNLDRNLGNWEKISLNFMPHTPIAYKKKREKHLVFIEIDAGVAAFPNVYFTDCNAARTKNKQLREKGMVGLTNVNFSIINGPAEPWNKNWLKYVQAEILVPHHIPLSKIKAIHFISNASKEYGEILWGERCNLFCISPGVFYDYYRKDKGALQFSYVKEVFISTRAIPKSRVYAIRTNAPHVVQGRPFWVIVHLHTTAGARVSISIDALRTRKDGEALKDFDGIFCSQFTVTKNVKWLEVKVYIDSILWALQRVRCEEMKNEQRIQ